MIEAVIVDVVRTASARGKGDGAFAGYHPVDLLADTLRALTLRNRLDPALIDDVYAGCVSQAGRQTYNIARNAVLAAGFPESVPGVTVDRQCGSGQQALSFAAQAIRSGAAEIIIACGVESMSSNPIGYSTLGEDPFGERIAARYADAGGEGLVGQGIAAELVTARWGFSRTQLDEFAARSHERADAASRGGYFDAEIHPVRGLRRDQSIRPGTTVAGLGTLPAAFREDPDAGRFPEISWSISAGNSSPLTDGAGAALVMSAEAARRLGLVPRARIHSMSVVGSDPLLMLTGVIPATERVLHRAGLRASDMDLIEVNEAFAPVPLAWLAETEVSADRLNIRGGAIALGHPLGASGLRILATLLGALEDTRGRYGLMTMCEGGGQANATIIERLGGLR